MHVPDAPVFRPTPEEFRDPLKYISSIRHLVQETGIAKIIPPEGFKPEFSVSMSRVFPTKLQRVDHLQQGKAFGDGGDYTMDAYRKKAEWMKKEYMRKHPDLTERLFKIQEDTSLSREVVEDKMCRIWEDEYWRIVDTCSEEVETEYGNDLDVKLYDSGFHPDENGKRHPWDLNLFPKESLSLLRAIDIPIPGMTSPWLYLGMLFATFCFHTEDHFLYSINYHHIGAPKIWYGVPRSGATKFEQALRDNVPAAFKESPDLLHRLVTMISPSVAIGYGVDMHRIVQHAGEFVITCPEAYHGGFNMGFNCGEAVNFALYDWLPTGREAVEFYKKGFGKRAVVFAHDKLLHDLCSSLVDSTAGVPCLPQDESDFYHTCLNEYSKAVEEEMLLRSWLKGEGVRSMHLGRDKIKEDDECPVCSTIPFFAAVTCACKPSRFVCLRHAFHTCGCDSKQKKLHVQVSAAEMMLLRKNIQCTVRGDMPRPHVAVTEVPQRSQTACW